MPWIITYVATLVAFLCVDALWLGITANSLYRQTLGDILLPSFKVAPAIVFYPAFAIGIVVFAVAPSLSGGSWQTAFIRGAMFGFFAYGLYDFTNLATLRNWTLGLSLTDVAWGTIVTGIAATAGYFATTYSAGH